MTPVQYRVSCFDDGRGGRFNKHVAAESCSTNAPNVRNDAQTFSDVPRMSKATAFFQFVRLPCAIVFHLCRICAACAAQDPGEERVERRLGFGLILCDMDAFRSTFRTAAKQ